MIETKNLKKTFQNGDILTEVLKGIDFKVENGEFIAIMGRSGAGKSTFLYQMSLLDEPTGGEVIIDGRDTRTMTMEEKTPFRLNNFGYVFQDYALLPDLTAIENVVLPVLMKGTAKESAYEKAKEALFKLDLTERLERLPASMSGGEQQRVSIARSVVNHPKVLFADEPTANLDNDSSWVIMDIFRDLHREGQTIIMITHEEQYARVAQRIITIDDGKIISTTKVEENVKSQEK